MNKEMPSKNCYLGIDPGLDGGFAVISDDRILYKMIMPTISFKTEEGKTRREIDRAGLLSFLVSLPVHTHVVVEKQQAYRKQDVTSSCTICKNFGLLLMALTVARMYITEVDAKDWQDYFGIVSVKKGAGTTKEQALHIVRKLYPKVDFRKSGRSHVAHDGIIDAVLIANYCKSLFSRG